MTDSETSAEIYRAPAFADFNPKHSAPGATTERLAHLETHGYVVINDFVDSPWIPKLREAGRRVTEACALGGDSSGQQESARGAERCEHVPCARRR